MLPSSGHSQVKEQLHRSSMAGCEERRQRQRQWRGSGKLIERTREDNLQALSTSSPEGGQGPRVSDLRFKAACCHGSGYGKLAQGLREAALAAASTAQLHSSMWRGLGGAVLETGI